MDITPYLLPWSNILLVASFFLTLGVLGLFVETAIIVRTLVLARQPPVRYVLLALPLGASVLFFFLTLYDWQVYAGFKTYGFITLGKVNPTSWNNWSTIQASCTNTALLSLLELAVLIALFILTFYLEKKLLPRINQRPLWTVVRRQRII
jgi:hypothetical protein